MQFVTYAVDGLYFHIRLGLSKFSPQIFDLGVYEFEAVCLVYIVAPDMFGQGGFLNQSAFIGEQIEQDVVLFAVERQFRPGYCHGPGGKIQGEIAQLYCWVSVELSSSEHRLHPCMKLCHVKWLRKVVVCPQIQTCDLVI